MINATGSQFSADIPASAANPPGIEYYIEAADAGNVARSGSAAAPHVIVIRAVAKGDIDGDGTLGVADIAYLVAYLFAHGPLPIGPGDVYNSGPVDVADLYYLANHHNPANHAADSKSGAQ